MTQKPLWIIFPTIFAISTFLFYPSLNYYFFQDDWFVLNWVRTGDFASFFSFRTDIIYWRPLSMPILFGLVKSLFGLNPTAFHLFALSIFFVLIVAVYRLFLLLKISRKSAIIGAFLYGTWSIHFIPLSWFSTTSYIIGPLFEVLSIIFFIKFDKSKKLADLVISFILFTLGIASSEFALTLPPILFAWGIFAKKRIIIKPILPFVAISLIYLSLRFFLFPIPAKGEYQIFLNKQLLNNFFWYIGWALGLPERFKSLIFLTLPAQSFSIITQFWPITLSVFLLTLTLLKLFLTNLGQNLRFYSFAIIWFTLGILPVITTVSHSFPMYLSLSGIGFLLPILKSLEKAKNLSILLFSILWLIISFTNLRFTRANHWVNNEQAISEAYTDYVQDIIKNPPSNSLFLFRPANINFSGEHNFVLVEGEDTLRLALNDQDAVKVIYQDSSLKSIYATYQQNVEIAAGTQIFEIAPSD